MVALALALLACFVSPSVSILYHNDTVHIYHYMAISDSVINGTQSSFTIHGTLHIKRDPSLAYAYYIALKNVTLSSYNGPNSTDYYSLYTDKSIPTVAELAIQKPFLIVYNETQGLQGLKFVPNDPVWSKNMKRGIASKFQMSTKIDYDLPITEQNVKFIEKTMLGDIWKEYNIRDPKFQNINTTLFAISDLGTSMNHNSSVIDQLTHQETEKCKNWKNPLNLNVHKYFEIEKQNSGKLQLKTLLANGVINNLLWNLGSTSHSATVHMLIIFKTEVELSEVNLPFVDFNDITTMDNIIYDESEISDHDYFSSDRLVRSHNDSVAGNESAIALLLKASDYFESDRLTIGPDLRGSQIINDLVDLFKSMNYELLQNIFVNVWVTIDNPLVKKLFIRILVQVGTLDTFNLSLNIIQSREVVEAEAKEMLMLLPLTIRKPNLSHLLAIKRLVESPKYENILDASILCMSNTIYKIIIANKDNPLFEIQPYLEYFYQFIEKEGISDEKKVTYLMAIMNIQVGDIPILLAPIIRNEKQAFKKLSKIRLMAIWAIRNSTTAGRTNHAYIYQLLNPILINHSESLKMRIAAYDVLVRLEPHDEYIKSISAYMMQERNPHLVHYHHTTLKSLASATDNCHSDLKSLARQYLMLSQKHTDNNPNWLSASYVINAFDKNVGHSEHFEMSLTINEETKFPEVIRLAHISTDGSQQPVKDIEIFLIVDGLGASNSGKPSGLGYFELDTKVQIDAVLIIKGRVIYTSHYVINGIFTLVGLLGELSRHPVLSWELGPHLFYQDFEEIYMVNELGLPVIIQKRSPFVFGLNCSLITTDATTLLSMNFKAWGHRELVLSTYNPLSDTWHSAKRSTALDISFPLALNISMNTKKRMPSLQFSFSFDPDHQQPAGVSLYVTDYTTVVGDKEGTLLNSCPTCNYHSRATNSSSAIEFERDYDFMDTGIRIKVGLHECQNGLSEESIKQEWMKSFKSPTNSWNDVSVHLLLNVVRQLKKHWLSPQIGSCGSIVRIEPSPRFPKRQVTVNIKKYGKSTLSGDFSYIPVNEEKEKTNWSFWIYFNVFEEFINPFVHGIFNRFKNKRIDQGYHIFADQKSDISDATPSKYLFILKTSKGIYPIIPVIKFNFTSNGDIQYFTPDALEH